MLKSVFFKYANYTNPVNYEHQYDNEKCREENREIRRILRVVYPKDLPLTDIGCGTGLGQYLLQEFPYIGVDRSAAAIAHCRREWLGTFIHTDAKDYIKTVDRLNPVFLFSLDYLKIETIAQYLEKTDELFIAIRYNEPFKSKTSVYSGRERIFRMIHTKKKRERLDRLLHSFGAYEFPLLDEPNYLVTIIDKRGPDRLLAGGSDG